MKKTIFAASAAIALMGAMPAAAADWYAQVNAGMSVDTQADATATVGSASASADGDLDNGFVVGAAAGAHLGNGLRLEGEALYSSNDLGGIDELDVDDVEVNHMGLFANVLYDFQMDGGFTPYIGAGVGFGSITFDVDGDSIHDEGTAWQIKAGVSYPVNDTLTLDVGYRYLNMASFEETFEDVEIDEDTTADIGLEFEPTAHILTVGARFKLGGAAS